MYLYTSSSCMCCCTGMVSLQVLCLLCLLTSHEDLQLQILDFKIESWKDFVAAPINKSPKNQPTNQPTKQHTTTNHNNDQSTNNTNSECHAVCEYHSFCECVSIYQRHAVSEYHAIFECHAVCKRKSVSAYHAICEHRAVREYCPVFEH